MFSACRFFRAKRNLLIFVVEAEKPARQNRQIEIMLMKQVFSACGFFRAKRNLLIFVVEAEKQARQNRQIEITLMKQVRSRSKCFRRAGFSELNLDY